MSSIKSRLLAALGTVLILTTLGTGAAIYYSLQSEVHRLLDDSMKQVALSFDNFRSQDVALLGNDFLSPDRTMVVQIYDPVSGVLLLSRRMTPFPIMKRVGFDYVEVEGERWHIYTTRNRFGQIVEVSQPGFVRDQMVFRTAKPVLLPLLIGMLLTGFVLWLLIGSLFRALSSTTQAIARRSPNSLTPLSTEHLPSEITPLVSALNSLLAQLAESLEAQKRFASDAAHELRTPLTALKLQLQLAERAKSDETRATAFGRLKEGIERATRLVTQLLTMARLDPENKERPFLPVDLSRLVQSVADDLSPLARQKGLDLKAEVPAGAAVVIANEDALRLVLTNLCDNAMRYTQAGGSIRIRAFLKDFRAVLEVADNGPGIPEAERERIFERFYRAKGTQTIPGTGIGLAIVRRVAEIHGGTPSVTDGLDGKGVCFRITFPVCQNSSETEI